MLSWSIACFSLFFVVVQSCTVLGPLGSSTSSRLKCEEKNKETSFTIGESVDFLFDSSSDLIWCQDKKTKPKQRFCEISCNWVFKPLHSRNYVELYVRHIEAKYCNISYTSAYVSNVFAKKICDIESVRGFKFIGSNISLQFNCKYPHCNYRIMIAVKETSPVYAGCDFKMSEKGYRYYLKYDLLDAGFEQSDLVPKGRPFPGMIIDNSRYSLYFVNKENLGVTTCFQDKIILPQEDIPSCHSSTNENCGWGVIHGVEKVNEIFELKGTHWKIHGLGQFKTISKSIQFEELCLYIEYFLNNVKYASVKIYGYISGNSSDPVLITERELSGDFWRVERIVADIPPKCKDKNLRLGLTVSLDAPWKDGSIYINKIYGCNPLAMEDQILISTGTKTELYGSFGEINLRTEGCCENDGKWVDNKCICPIGFAGKHCEKSCGDNLFGQECASECTLFNTGCEKIIICDDFIGCSCTPDFKGYYCQVCVGKWWCEDSCFSRCNDYDPPDCDDNVSYNIFAFDIKSTEASVEWEEETENNSDCKPTHFELTLISGSASESLIVNNMTYRFTGLLPNTTYTVRVKPLLKRNPSFYYVTFITALPDLNLDILFVESRMVGLKWDPNDKRTFNYKLGYKCVTIRGWRTYNCSHDANEFPVSGNQFNITNLYPSRNYTAYITTDDHGGTRYNKTQFLTKQELPESVKIDVYMNKIQSTEANVTLDLTECIHCNGIVIKFYVEILHFNEDKVIATYENAYHNLLIFGLYPGRHYTMRVYPVNSVGYNRSVFIEYDFTSLKSDVITSTTE